MKSLSLFTLAIIATLASCKQSDQPVTDGYYKVYINDDRMDYIDPNTGQMIYSEFVNWEHPTRLQREIIKHKSK